VNPYQNRQGLYHQKQNIYNHSMGSYDAVVVGLGPGGAAAAHNLALAGLKVLVLDSRKYHKPCGGCLSDRWRFLLNRLDPPDWLWEYPIKLCTMAAPGQKPVSWRSRASGAYLVERSRLDAWLSDAARAAGARIIPQRATRIEQNAKGVRVYAGDKIFRAGWLIGADGASGLCARSLGLKFNHHRFATLVEERPMPGHLKGLTKNGVLIELGGVMYGYGWLFARGGTLNLGMGSWHHGKGARRGSLRLAYAGFLKRYDLGAPGRFRGAAIPCPAYRHPRPYQGRVLLLGDAGGLADPFLGEGIGQAMCTGLLAAKAVIAEDAGTYGRLLKKGLLKEHFHAWLLARTVYARPYLCHRLLRRHPGALELGFQLLRGETMHRGIWGAVISKIFSGKASLDPPPGSNYTKLLN
jgi:geranylgeranyl reductase family protein